MKMMIDALNYISNIRYLFIFILKDENKRSSYQQMGDAETGHID